MMIFCKILFYLLVFKNCTLAQLSDDKLREAVKSIFGNDTDNGLTTEDTTANKVEDCKCVAYYLCNDTDIKSNGAAVIDLRIGENECDEYFQRCCFLSQIVEERIMPNNTNYPSTCGWRNTEGVGFVIVGDDEGEAKFGEFPWTIAVLFGENLGQNVSGSYRGSGSLIHPRVVLTAAHCVDEKDAVYTARAGEWDTQTTSEIRPHQDRKVKSVIIHPDYYREAALNDVALLILDEAFVLDQHINVACLPPQNSIAADGTGCWANGWGKDKFGANGTKQVIMKKIALPIVNRDTCQDNLRTTRLSAYFQLHESFICAGGELGKDTCEGDGGGPLVCPILEELGRYEQVGIVSWGIGCGMAGVPGVYVNVGLFRNWIDEEMNKQDFNTTVYVY